jgi:hypothetical protein
MAYGQGGHGGPPYGDPRGGQPYPPDGYGYGYGTAQYPAYPGYGPPGPTGGPPGPPPPPPRRSAPAVVHLVAVLYYVSGLVLLLGAVAIGLVTFGDRQVAGYDLPAFVDSYGLELGALAAFLGLVALLLGRRLQRGRQWARMFVLGLSVLSLGANLWTLFTTGTAEPLTGLVLPILSLILLNTTVARTWFRHRTY